MASLSICSFFILLRCGDTSFSAILSDTSFFLFWFMRDIENDKGQVKQDRKREICLPRRSWDHFCALPSVEGLAFGGI